ncbi:MAG: TonB-dependent receptor [Acidobacteria bacterium]|nr:TonB-dependent receptor [Acidobacteriota bacterium]
MRYRLTLAALAACVAGMVPTPAAQAQEQHQPSFSGTTEVVASRIAGKAEDAGRREVILTRQEIEALPVHDLEGLLALLPGVGLARRGLFGAQADLSLRGSTFEQTLILVNGVRVSHPQTGHHALDLFIPIEAIDHIEVLYGPGSAAYGPGAFGGAINIVTRTRRPIAQAAVGSHGLADGGAGIPLGGGAWAAVHRTVHTGFRDDTELAVNKLAAGWRHRTGRWTFDVAGAAGKRHFGAWRFYSNAFPLERERTAGALVTGRLGLRLGKLRFGGYVRANRHLDHFVLDRNRPAWYVNDHRTDGVLAGLTAGGDLGAWKWTVGTEAARDTIHSSNLGHHHRVETAVYGELGRFGTRTTADLQIRLDHEEPWGSVTTLAVGGSIRLGRGVTLRAQGGQSFRAPSFTELYYRSPATMGNAALKPERGRTVEAGLDAGPWSLTVFHRSAHPLIDFVLSDDGAWHARNLGGLTADGLEAAVFLPAIGRLTWQRLSVEWIGTSLAAMPGRSEYALAHPRLEAAWTGAADLGRGWTAGMAARFRDPQASGSWATLDLKVGRRILKGMDAVLEADNLFDRSISELHGIPLPGRWISLRLVWRGDR